MTLKKLSLYIIIIILATRCVSAQSGLLYVLPTLRFYIYFFVFFRTLSEKTAEHWTLIAKPEQCAYGKAFSVSWHLL